MKSNSSDIDYLNLTAMQAIALAFFNGQSKSLLWTETLNFKHQTLNTPLSMP